LTLKNIRDILSIPSKNRRGVRNTKNILIALVAIVCIVSAGCISKDCTPVATSSTATSHVYYANQKITISPTSVDRTVGDSIQFTAQTSPSATVIWSIGKGGTGAGIVDSNGVITPTRTGTIIVVATAGDASSTALITVKEESRYSKYYYNYRNGNDDDDHVYRYNRYNNYNHDRSSYDSDCDQSKHNHPVYC